MIFATKKYHKKYCIFRILGNETPPRDEPDARLKTLEFILDNEPTFNNAIKCWVINCIHDKARRELICKMLSDRNMYYIIVPLWRQKYLESKNKEEKITQAIGINRARNFAIQHGKLFSKFTFVLDGDCFFSNNLWEKTYKEIEKDQKDNPRRMYYSIPTSRATCDHAIKSDDVMLLAEPMLCFRDDGEKYFDENIPFGQGDKLKLLYQLGHNQDINKHHIVHGDLCKSVGMVQHITQSDYEIEINTQLRIKLRNESIDRLIWQIDNPNEAFPNYVARNHGKPNEYWKKIQGWFDFRGQYSQFAYQSNNGCKFVEVGSWLGASICYLAWEFKNRNKNAELYAVDTWQGSNEEIHKQLIDNLGGSDLLYQKFLQNIENSGISNYIKPIRKSSIEASKMFEDESLDIVFIDASHDYENVKKDIISWLPKVKKNGIISGHDYVAGHRVSENGVIRAVNEIFLGKNLEIGQAGRTWLHVKI